MKSRRPQGKVVRIDDARRLDPLLKRIGTLLALASDPGAAAEAINREMGRAICEIEAWEDVVAAEIASSQGAGDSMLRGANTVPAAIGTTLGAKGEGVGIEEPSGAPRSTKEDVTVAKAIELRENTGNQLIKEPAAKTNEKVDDGVGAITIFGRRFETGKTFGRHFETNGGIIIPDTAKEKSQDGNLAAAGFEIGKIQAFDLKAGYRILFGKYSGSEIKLEREDLLIMKESDVLAVLGEGDSVVIEKSFDAPQSDGVTGAKEIELSAKFNNVGGQLILELAPKTNDRAGDGATTATVLARAKRHSIEESLRRAVERQEFLLHYQPRVNLLTGAITGAEALLRWLHPTRGMVLPDEFIPVAEDCGLILPIGNWVRTEACRQVKAWRDAGLNLGSISVNVSAMEFRSETFLKDVFATLEQTRLDPRILQIELTESALTEHADRVEAVVKTLHAKGVQVAIDDFGTGSSMRYLRRSPITALKIDQSFVSQIGASTKDSAIVTAIIALAKSLWLRVIAEGVETQQEVDFLRGNQCDEVQGCYFSCPVPADNFEALLGTSYVYVEMEEEAIGVA